MLTIISTLIPVFGIILLGIVVERMRFMPSGMAMCLNQFVYWIGLPSMLFNQLARMGAGQISQGFIWGILLSTAVCYVLSQGIASRGFRIRKRESTVFAMMSSFPNSAFMGLPIVVLLLPGHDVAALVASLCAVLYTAVLLVADGMLELEAHKDEGRARALRSLGRALAHNPLLVASALGAVVSLTGLPMPMPVMAMTAMLGATAAPCALFGMGMILGVQLTSSRGFVPGWFRQQLPVHVFKLLIMPVLTFVCLELFGASGDALGVGTLLAGMPTGVAAYVVAEKFRVSTDDASLGIVVNTGLSLVTIPLTILLLQLFGRI